jgi:hypothetical protein
MAGNRAPDTDSLRSGFRHFAGTGDPDPGFLGSKVERFRYKD